MTRPQINDGMAIVNETERKGGYVYYTRYKTHTSKTGKTTYQKSTTVRKIRPRVRPVKVITIEKKIAVNEIKKIILSNMNHFSLTELLAIVDVLNKCPADIIKLTQPQATL
jgi:hypothetical protein